MVGAGVSVKCSQGCGDETGMLRDLLCPSLWPLILCPTDTPESRTSISVEVSPEMRYLALPCTGIILCRALEVLSDLAPPGHQAHSLKEGASVLQQGPHRLLLQGLLQGLSVDPLDQKLHGFDSDPGERQTQVRLLRKTEGEWSQETGVSTL